MTEQHEKAVREYMQRSSEIIRLLDGQVPKITEIVSLLDRAREQGHMIFIMGNGGSASTASHMANDLNKTAGKEGGKRFRMMAITDNVPIMLAIGNDISYDDIFVEQLKNFLEKDDVVIGLSGSGNSKNVLKAMEVRERQGRLHYRIDSDGRRKASPACETVGSDTRWDTSRQRAAGRP